MSVYASFDNASILRLVGWGKIVDPTDRYYRVELADIGQLAIYEPGLLREKQMLTVSIEHLQFSVWTRQTTTGGFIGGGIGIGGALMGMAEARILNALTRKTHEDTLLGIAVTLPNGTQRDITLGFRDLNESDLRDTLAPAIRGWADGYIKAQLTTMTPASDQPDLTTTHTTIDRMRRRLILDDDQALILASHASQPFIDAVSHKLRAGTTTPTEAQRIRRQIDALHRKRRITNHQAQQVHDLLGTTPTPTAAPPPTNDNGEQIELLTRLRQTGAISETEYQAEKRRLRHTRQP